MLGPSKTAKTNWALKAELILQYNLQVSLCFIYKDRKKKKKLAYKRHEFWTKIKIKEILIQPNKK